MVVGFGSVFQVGGAVLAVVVLSDVAAFTVLGAAIIGGMVIGPLAAPRVIALTNRRGALIGANLAAAVIYLAMFLIGPRSMVLVAAGLFLAGLTLGVNLVSTTAMIGDTADHVELLTGQRTDGSCFAGLTFTSTLCAALATLAFGSAVAASGYEAGRSSPTPCARASGRRAPSSRRSVRCCRSSRCFGMPWTSGHSSLTWPRCGPSDARHAAAAPAAGAAGSPTQGWSRPPPDASAWRRPVWRPPRRTCGSARA